MTTDNKIEKIYYKYTASHIANYFLLRAKHDKISDMTPMKLIKLVYIAYAWYYAISKKKLFKEKIEAWKNGPVVPSLHHEFKRFRNESIDEFSRTRNVDDDLFPLIYSDDYLTGVILLRVWKSYKNKDGTTLSMITHGSDSFWDRIYNQGSEEEPYDKHLEHIEKGARAGIVKFYGEGGLLMKEDIEKLYGKEGLVTKNDVEKLYGKGGS